MSIDRSEQGVDNFRAAPGAAPLSKGGFTGIGPDGGGPYSRSARADANQRFAEYTGAHSMAWLLGSLIGTVIALTWIFVELLFASRKPLI